MTNVNYIQEANRSQCEEGEGKKAIEEDENDSVPTQNSHRQTAGKIYHLATPLF